MVTMLFEATVEPTGKTTTGIPVPDEVLAELGGAKRPAVRVTLNGHVYRTTVGVMGGRALISVSAAVREAAAVAAGDPVAVEVELDTEPRELPVPADLAALLDADTRRFFDGLSYSRRQRFVLPIEEARTEETRRRRIDKAAEALSARRQQP
ncbi:DUF1905 domain-containing protein [Streptacidiphilus rugosus]|uniref:DUF1905 domain-containing protein n=1 Tax=Streptacidiphilus rugosus TaxID=405783 RepID=UPI001E52183F|nr:DUF1905 domain-containing protein [Streptacidiphilus rugosus]